MLPRVDLEIEEGQLHPAPQAPSLMIANGRLRIRPNTAADRDLLKAVEGRVAVKAGHGGWEFPLDPAKLREIQRALPALELGAEVWNAARAMAAKRQRVEAARTEPLPTEHTMPIAGVTPYEHQHRAYRIGIATLSAGGAYAVLHDCGLGKSLTITAILGRLAACSKNRSLVVCPASVIGVWEREVAKFADFPVRLVPLTGPVARRAAKIMALDIEDFDGATILVTNYESVWRPPMMKAIAHFAPHAIVCDEAHRLKNPGAKQSKAAREIGEGTYRIAATGTPVDKLEDWFGIYRFLDPTVFGTSSAAFRARYFHEVQLPGGAKFVTGVKEEMLGELTAKAHSLAHACSKDEALDLPEQIDIERYCDLEPAAAKQYKQLRDECIAFMESGEAIVAANALTKILRLAQVTGGFTTTEDGKTVTVSEAKLSLLAETLADVLRTERKVVIFAQRTAEIDRIDRLLKSAKDLGLVGESVGRIIDGRVSADERTKRIAAFQDAAEPRVLIVQNQAGGAGITLHASSLAIYFSLPSSSIDYEQTRGRIHRSGQVHKCRYIHLLCSSTIDEKLLTALRSKQTDAKTMLHNWKELLR